MSGSFRKVAVNCCNYQTQDVGQGSLLTERVRLRSFIQMLPRAFPL